MSDKVSDPNNVLSEMRDCALNSCIQMSKRSYNLTCTLPGSTIKNQKGYPVNDGYLYSFAVPLKDLIDGFDNFSKTLNGHIDQATKPANLPTHHMATDIMFSPVFSAVMSNSKANENVIATGISIAFATPPELQIGPNKEEYEVSYSETRIDNNPTVFYKAINNLNQRDTSNAHIVGGKTCAHILSHTAMEMSEIYDLSYSSIPAINLYGDPSDDPSKTISTMRALSNALPSPTLTPETAKADSSSVLHGGAGLPTIISAYRSSTLVEEVRIPTKSYIVKWLKTINRHPPEDVSQETPSHIVVSKDLFTQAIYTLAYAWGKHRNSTFENCAVAFDIYYNGKTPPPIHETIRFVLRLDFIPITFTKADDIKEVIHTNVKNKIMTSITSSTKPETYSGKIFNNQN